MGVERSADRHRGPGFAGSARSTTVIVVVGRSRVAAWASEPAVAEHQGAPADQQEVATAVRQVEDASWRGVPATSTHAQPVVGSSWQWTEQHFRTLLHLGFALRMKSMESSAETSLLSGIDGEEVRD